MLSKALKIIQEMSSFSLSQLAKSLNVDKNMAAHLVEQLKAMGYLREENMNVSCNGNCVKCMSCPGASDTMPIKFLSVTEKGNRALKQQRN